MQFRSSTPDLHNFYNSFLQKNRAFNALFLLFLSSRPRTLAYLIYIHAKPTRRQASKQPSGYTLRLRPTRIIRYAHASTINGHTASPIGSA